MNRREFSKAVKVEIIKRATPQGTFAPPWCEQCSDMAAKFEIDHRDPDAMQIDKSRKLTAADGWLLCIDCHSAKTKVDVKAIAKAKRVEAKHLGATKPEGKIQSAGFRKTEKSARVSTKTSLPPRAMFK